MMFGTGAVGSGRVRSTRLMLAAATALVLTAGALTPATAMTNGASDATAPAAPVTEAAPATTTAPATVPKNRIEVTGTVTDAQGQPLPGTEVVLFRLRTAAQKARSFDKGDTQIAATQAAEDGSYTLRKTTTKTGARYAVLFIVDANQAALGYYSSWATQPRSWESLVIPTNGDALAYFGVDAAPGSSFRLDPGHARAMGTSKLQRGGRLTGTLDCPAASSNRGQALIEGRSSSLREIWTILPVTSSGALRPKFSLPAGSYRVSSELKKCRFGKDPIIGYSAVTPVTVRAGVTTAISVKKAPVKATKRLKLSGTAKAGKTIRIRGAWPSGTTVRYAYYDGGGWRQFSKPQLRIPKRLAGKTLKISVRTEHNGRFAGAYLLKKKVKK